MQVWLGLRTPSGSFDLTHSVRKLLSDVLTIGANSSLDTINDYGTDFKKIADIIELNPPDLFVEF